MKIDLTTVINDAKGKPLKEVVVKASKDVVEVTKDVTLKDILINVLLTEQQGEKTAADVKYKRYKLFKCIDEEVAPDLTHEQVVMLKERSGLLHTPLIMGQVYDILEGTDDVGTE